MHDNCDPNGCPVNARVDALESRFDRFENDAKSFHEKIDDRVSSQETLAAVQKEKLEELKSGQGTILEKLDALIGKPGKRWEGLVDKALWLVVGGVISYLLFQAGVPV